MYIKRICLSLLALLPCGPLSVMAQSELLNADAESLREPFGGDIAKARKMLFMDGHYETSRDEAYERFGELLNEEMDAEVSQEEQDRLFDEAIDLLEKRGLLQEEEFWIVATPSGWGAF